MVPSFTVSPHSTLSGDLTVCKLPPCCSPYNGLFSFEMHVCEAKKRSDKIQARLSKHYLPLYAKDLKELIMP
jgi:hypothetical protein